MSTTNGMLRRSSEAERGLFHLCSSKLKDCSVRIGRGDRRELVHVQRWRLVSPLIMVENEYIKSLGLQLVREWVENFHPAQRVPPRHPRGGVRDDTGLENVAEVRDGQELGAEGEDKPTV